METKNFFLSCMLLPCITLAQLPHLSSGTLKRYEHFASQNIDPRTIDVWLPEKYTPEKKYAVLYMHDGQMLFDSTVTWNKQAWCIDATLNALERKKKIRNCIVVAIWNNGEKRHAEFFPQKALNYLPSGNFDELNLMLRGGPVADRYLSFIVKELKPFIDSTFSTLPDQSNTFIAGSSMGGLISLYAVCEYPEVFHGAACLSTHWTGIYRSDNNPVPAALIEYMQTHLPSPADHKIYFDYGTKELDSLYAPFQAKADAVMKSKGYTSSNWMTKEFPGESHNETAWRKRFAIPAVFLLSK
ncbi:MAG: hypothetical protein K1X61_11035 [Chitinophagales bacterium]|nr:hypothetical protein [Chitinophagales bacterium]